MLLSYQEECSTVGRENSLTDLESVPTYSNKSYWSGEDNHLFSQKVNLSSRNLLRATTFWLVVQINHPKVTVGH